MKSFFTLSFIAFAIFSQAQPGTIDKTYGTDKTGTVSVSNRLSTGAAALQPGDKLVIGGLPSVPQSRNFILARHNKGGSSDTSFGDKGEVVTNLDDLVKNIKWSFGWTSVAIEPDGKIVAAGSIGWYNPDYPPEYPVQFDVDIVVARFLPDGTPDESFGNKGRVVTNLGYLENIRSVAVQPDGKIVVAGDQTTDVYGNSNGMLVVRYNPDGSLDESFGENEGYAVYDQNGGGNYGYAMLLQPDGKIVIGGSQLGVNDAFLVLRYLPNGRLDASFGKGGAVKTTFSSLGSFTQINNIALDEKGRICAVGVLSSDQGVAVTRYLPDGTPDNMFNEDGKFELNFSNVRYTNANNLLVQPGNKLVVTACIIPNKDSMLRETLTGLNEDGSPDASFGTDNGQIVTDIGISDDAGVDAVMQSDGKIILSGTQYNYKTNITTYLLARFNGYPVHVSLAVRIKRFLQNHGITWKGLPEEDKIAYYSVEQSGGKGSGFASLAKVSGRANLNDYSFTNNRLLTGTNYYRVKAVSVDGTVRYSEVVSADNRAASASVYPNPARSYITVQGLPVDATANITLKDGSGTVLQRGVSGGSAQYRSSLANLLPGTYYLNITTTNGKTEVLPFVKE